MRGHSSYYRSAVELEVERGFLTSRSRSRNRICGAAGTVYNVTVRHCALGERAPLWFGGTRGDDRRAPSVEPCPPRGSPPHRHPQSHQTSEHSGQCSPPHSSTTSGSCRDSADPSSVERRPPSHRGTRGSGVVPRSGGVRWTRVVAGTRYVDHSEACRAKQKTKPSWAKRSLHLFVSGL